MSGSAPISRPTPNHAPVRAALLGSGLFATNSYLPSLVGVPGLSVTAVWSRSEKSVTVLAEKASELSLPVPSVFHGDDGLASILADKEVRAVVMVLPLGVQPDLIRKCWAAGKHVISEKPIGRDVAQARELIEEWERDWAHKGIVWRVAESTSPRPQISRSEIG